MISTNNSRVRCNPNKTKRLIDYMSQRIYSPYQPDPITSLAKNHTPFLHRLNLMKKLPVHDGCVNTICWNKTGDQILSGSDDRNLCITKPTYLFDDSEDYNVLHKVRTRHLGNIFDAQFIPNSADTMVVSCSSDGPVLVHDIMSADPSKSLLSYNCHAMTICKTVTIKDNDNIFLTCSEDKTIRLFDMRVHKSCSRPGTCPHPYLIRNSHPITTLAVHPLNTNLLLAGRADGMGLVYDRRKLPDVSSFSRERAHQERLSWFDEHLGAEGQPSTFRYMHPLDGVVGQFTVPMDEKCRFTSLCYSADGSQVLASYSEDYIYLFNHDRSSNFELIQTLPKKSPNGREADDDSNDSDSNGTNRSSREERNISSRATRIQRMRMRGDWSDTGINSTPRLTGARPQSNLIRHMTEVALTLRTRSLNRRQESESNSDNASNTTDSWQTIDEDPEEGYSREQHNTTDNNLEESNRRSNNHELTPNQEPLAGRNSPARRSPRCSEETKAKFRKASENLRDKYKEIPIYEPRVKYQGHRNCRTSIKQAIFWGDDFIMSGSDCGRIMVWEKDTAKLVMGFPADERVVNCLAPNPHHYALASSGIDYDIKIWSTQGLRDGPLRASDEDMAQIVKNNELMLEESKQTISVPPEIFFQVLAQLARDR